MHIKIYVDSTVFPFLVCNCVDFHRGNGQRNSGVHVSKRVFPTKEGQDGHRAICIFFLPLWISCLDRSHCKFRKHMNCWAQMGRCPAFIHSMNINWITTVFQEMFQVLERQRWEKRTKPEKQREEVRGRGAVEGPGWEAIDLLLGFWRSRTASHWKTTWSSAEKAT